MKIQLKEENGKIKKIYEKKRFTLRDWYEAISFQKRQEERINELDKAIQKNEKKETFVSEETVDYNKVVKISFDEGLAFLVTIFDHQFTVEELTEGLSITEYRAVVDEAVGKCLGGEANSEKK